jgi:hypothetical protein
MKSLIAFLLLVSLAGLAAGAELYPDALLATRTGAYSARALGMGRTVLTSEYGAPALLCNPALLAGPEDSLRLDATVDLTRVKETRAYPIHDAFTGVLAYNNYVLNDHLYSKLDGGAVYNIPSKRLSVLALGVGSYSVYQFDYRYHEEVRYRNAVGGILDMPMANNRLDINGDLRSISLGAAVRERFPVTVGLSANLLTGKWTYEEGTFWVSPDSANIVTHTEYSLKGTPAEIVAGVACELSERVSLGARALVPTGSFEFDTKTRIEQGGDTVFSSGSVSQRYPSRFGLGVQYRPRSDFMPRILLEGEYVTYSDVRSGWKDILEIHSGVEQQVVRGVPVRAGFYYAKAPDNSERSLATFSMGIGMQVKRFFADFGMELGKVAYSNPDLFPNTRFGGVPIDMDHVDTGLWRGIVSVHYEL